MFFLAALSHIKRSALDTVRELDSLRGEMARGLDKPLTSDDSSIHVSPVKTPTIGGQQIRVTNTLTSVFVSYSHDSGDHEQRVLTLADQLCSEGLDVRLDQYVVHPSEGWPQWTQRQVVECDFVLLVCTPTYRRRYDREETPGVGHGVTWEALIAGRLLYQAGARNDNMLPVLLEGGTDRDIPLSLRSFTYYALPDGYDDLYRRLTNQPKTPPPPIGVVRPMPPAPRPTFMARAHVDNQETSIGRELVVEGTVNFGPTTIDTPSRSPAPASAPSPTASPPTPAIILLCTANAAHPGRRLQLEEELRAIDDALQRSRLRDRYTPRMCLAVTFTKVVHELDDHEPTFLHFSGHGDRSGRLILKGERNEELHVPPASMAQLLAMLRTRPTLVTFATCHSRAMAQAAAQHAAFAIGFDGALDDESVPLFSATLYERLASRADLDVPRAFNLARLACQASGHESVGLARLFEHPGREVE
jgi:hypothetical protein